MVKMPLLKKKPFKRYPLPENLTEDEEVFHCEMTNEVFRDYEDYCRRILLCNSMIWTCAATGKSNLTYTEALESEQNTQRMLKDFPMKLKIPILYLANKTQKTAFAEIVDDVFVYIRDRYFVGETVEALFIGNKWRESHVRHVIAPSEEEILTAHKNGQSTDRQCFPPASLYRYQVEQLDAEDQDVSEVMIVDYDHIRRKKSSYSREKTKVFLKQFVEQNPLGILTIKESALESYGINKITFDQIFDGPAPSFAASQAKRTSKNVNGKKSKQETLADFLKKNNGAHSSENSVNLLEQMKKRQAEFQEMKQKRADERLAEKQKQKEENVKISVFLKDWYKPKEDLELENHKTLPVPAPLQLKVPDKYVGDVLEILEFVHSFSKVLSANDYFSPGGLTLELFERALTQKEVAGPLLDIIQMFLSAIFYFQSEESKQYSIKPERSYDLKEKDLNDNMSLSEATNFATKASHWSNSYQGSPLSQLPLYSLTTSEILRLHLLSSGARINETGAKYRYQLRGGYTSEDDPGLYLRIKQPHILKSLALHNITELSIGDKLKVLHCLMNQLLTYADVRDVIEDRLEKTKQIKVDLKSAQIAERRRDQEYITARCKIRKDNKENKKDITSDLDNLWKSTERQKMENERKIEKLMKLTTENQTWLGSDRAYRKYYKLDSIPGLLINSEEDNPGVCLDKCVKQNSDLVDAGRSEVLAHIRKMYEDYQLKEECNGIDDDKTDENHKLPKLNGLNGSITDPNYDPDSLLVCSADPSTCIVHSNKNKQNWLFFHKRDHVAALTNSLNERGARESELKQTIVNNQTHLELLIDQTPINQLNPNIRIDIEESDHKPKIRRQGKPKYDDANLGYPPEMDSITVLQHALAENILELESKIHAGNLGKIKIKDRDAWRENLSSHAYDLVDKTIVLRRNDNNNGKIKKENERPETPDIAEQEKEHEDPGKFLGPTLEVDSEDSDDDASVLPLSHHKGEKLAIQTLAIALVQIGQGVDYRYLKKPLGNFCTKKDKSLEGNILERWERSLLSATSYSQIFLHYSTLDNCIVWSRSALLARCKVCRRTNDSENMLLCDNCNKGHHLYCLKPKLYSIPVGDWYCMECKKQKEKEAKPPPPQKKRRIFKEELSDEESEKSEGEVHKSEPMEEDYDEGMDESSDDGDEEREVCRKCGSGGTLLCCDCCPSMYHLECAEPPLRRVPRGVWYCPKCKTRKLKDTNYSDESHLTGSVAQRSGSLQNQRRCAARARYKIYGFARSLRRISESEESDSGSDTLNARRSNRREFENRDDLPLHNAPLQELLSDILKQDCAWPFIRPVQKFEVPDYYDIITKPMDFGTIKYKLNMGEYKSDSDVMTDALLVFENCNTYNNSEDEVYRCGVKLQKYFINKCRELNLNPPSELENDEDLEPPENKRKRTN